MRPDVAASIKARLLAIARREGEEFERTLTRFAAERLLYRIGASAVRDRCILKGASLLSVWLPNPYRVTRDVDLLWTELHDQEAVRALLGEVCAVSCPEDGLRFDLSTMRVDVIQADAEFAGTRARFLAYLGKARIPVQVDLGAGDAMPLAPEEIDYPTILDHLPPPLLRAYPREATVAEKFEAMVKLDIQHSRMKDFHDIWALSGAFAFKGPRLRQAVDACFERRGIRWTADVPRPLTAVFYQMPELATRWTSYLAAGAVLAPPPTAFDTVGERITRFLGPVRESIVAGTEFEMRWPADGPWRSLTGQREGGEGDV